MPTFCVHCQSQHTLNLDTVRKLGIATGGIAGSLRGAYLSFSSSAALSVATSARFPLSKVAYAVMAGASSGIAGAATGHQLVKHLLPPGDGTPWLCLDCDHAFRTQA